MADANPDGHPPRSAEHIARFLVVSAREDHGLIRRSRPVELEDFLDRVRHLPAMLFENAPGATPFLRSALSLPLADEAIIGARPRDAMPHAAMPRAQAATHRLELAIEAADRSEQSLAAMQSALNRAHRRNLVFGVAACAVVAASLGVTTLGRGYFGGNALSPQAVAAAVTPAIADTLAVRPLSAATQGAAAPSNGITASVQPVSTTILTAHTTSPAIEASSDSQSTTGVPRQPVSQAADSSTRPRLIDARSDSDSASALLRSLPPGSIIVSPLPEPVAAEPIEQPDSAVQPISVTRTATVEALPPRHHYAAARRTRSYRTVNRQPTPVGRLVENLGRDIRSLFH